jgi:Kef-type K+ transport system membrane component KefB
VLLLAVTAGWAARRVGLPAVLDYLATGLVVSPFTPGYVASRHELGLPPRQSALQHPPEAAGLGKLQGSGLVSLSTTS